MRRNTNLDDVLFDVQLRALLVNLHNSTEQQPALFDRLIEVPRYKAVVDIQRGTVLCVVTNDYQLVSNARAIEIGKEYFKKVFGQTTTAGMEVFNINRPATRSFCHVDFVHKDDSFEPWQDEKWAPFLRVTNSYNRTKLLRFDIGFCRWICANGVIFGKRGVTVRFQHTRQGMEKLGEMDIGASGLEQLKVEFIERLNNLKRYHVPRKEMLPLSCKVFGLNLNESELFGAKRIMQLTEFRESISSLTAQYFDEMGENAYAALSVLTDFAARPRSYISPVAVMDALQKKTGDWMDEFIPEIKKDDFKFDNYLTNFKESAKIIASLN